MTPEQQERYDALLAAAEDRLKQATALMVDVEQLQAEARVLIAEAEALRGAS